jgi:hypothetical protein
MIKELQWIEISELCVDKLIEIFRECKTVLSNFKGWVKRSTQRAL